MLVPVINGRRTGDDIVERLRRKWDLGHSWLSALDSVRAQAESLSELKGPAGPVLDRLTRDFETLAPESVTSLRALVQALGDHGVPLDRVELDLGFGRGIGFYSQVVFSIVAPTPDGPVEICGGGRYDGLARVFGSDRDDRGAGFAFGLERLDAVLNAQGIKRGGEWCDREPSTLVVARSPAQWKDAVQFAGLIRAGLNRAILEVGWEGRYVFDRARGLAATHIILVGASKGETCFMALDEAGQPTRRVEFDGVFGLAALLNAEEPKS